jgi:hypothetical protein
VSCEQASKSSRHTFIKQQAHRHPGVGGRAQGQLPPVRA